MNRKNIKIDKSKTINFNKYLDDKYGKKGTTSREEFIERAFNYYYGEILKERRKELKLTQAEVAAKIGKPRPYVSQIENGRDMRLSSLIAIAQALDLKLELTPI